MILKTVLRKLVWITAFCLGLTSFQIRGSAAENSGSAWDIPADAGQFHLFLFMGQSNMSGCGEMLPGDEKPVPGVLMLPEPAAGENSPSWKPAAHPLHGDQFGLGLPFAIEYRRLHPDVTVGLIPLGRGGAPLYALGKGTAIYEGAMARAAFAGRKGVLKGVLWQQGESDTVEPDKAATYATRLDAFIAGLRQDLGKPELPFTAGDLAEFYGTGPDHNAPDRVARIHQVRSALKGLPDRVPHTAFVETSGLSSLDAHMVHFDRASLITLGTRHAGEMQALLTAAPVPAGAAPAPGPLTGLDQLPPEAPAGTKGDWLTAGSPGPWKAAVYRGSAPNEIVLSNGLIRRAWRLAPNAAMVSFDNLMTGASMLRGVKPEAALTLDGLPCPVGGLNGQPDYAYLLPEWIAALKSEPLSFQFTGFETGPTLPRFAWKRVRYSEGRPWPPPGVSLTLHFSPSPELTAKSGNPEFAKLRASVHYELYDDIPLISKWITVRNGGSRAVRLNRFTSELIAAVEYESVVDLRDRWEYPNLHVESDYEFRGMDPVTANQAVRWIRDPQYTTQVSSSNQTPCLLEVRPEGPDTDIAPGGDFESFRTFELVNDSTDRERKGMALRRMYRTMAPWSTENPIIMHVSSAEPDAVKLAVDQAAETGFEMVIMTFGSGLDMENESPEYLAGIKSLVEYANAKGIELGGYSLLGSRQAGPLNDVVHAKEGPFRFAMPWDTVCLGSQWGQNYFRKLYGFFEKTGMNLLEHDGSYPGDHCASTGHPGHHGLEDSQWSQWKKITDFYRWCRARGTYLNVPDFYYLNGSNKCGMGYREATWSLPRRQQIIHARQQIFDGTWQKTPSMGWMFVPLTNYSGGGEAAVIEPLKDHLEDYSAIMANLFGSGVQACYRGPRLYDTDETRAVVKKWVDFYKRHRPILDSDLLHLRRADGRDLDYMMHVNPALKEKALLTVFNPLDAPVSKKLTIPLYYTGLSGNTTVRTEGGAPQVLGLDRKYQAEVEVSVPAQGSQFLIFE